MDKSTHTPTSVYRYYDRNDLLLYVGVTSRGITRNREHNTTKEWWPYVVRQDVDHYPTRTEALTAEKSLIQGHTPPFNRQHNPRHDEARRSYLRLSAALNARATTATERRATRGRFPLRPLSAPMPGHDFTLHSSPVDATALPGGLIITGEAPIVSSQTRKHAGHVCDIQFRGGILLIGIKGKNLPDTVTHGKAHIKAQNKPAGFYVAKVLINDPNDIPGGA